MSIHIKTGAAIQKMRDANKIVADTHQMLEEFVKPGISTYELNRIGEEFIEKQGAYPCFKGYQDYPAGICISVNEEVVHGIPSKKRILHNGDIVSLDIGALYNGYNGDAARTHAVGNITPEAKRLIDITRESFFKGVEFALPENHLYQISKAIQEHAEKNGFSVVRDLVGHGIGKDIHEDPQVPNFKPVGRGPKLVPGMCLAIEPMINQGSYEVRVLSDDWTFVTIDGKLSAHYENTILITNEGYEILTLY